MQDSGRLSTLCHQGYARMPIHVSFAKHACKASVCCKSCNFFSGKHEYKNIVELCDLFLQYTLIPKICIGECYNIMESHLLLNKSHDVPFFCTPSYCRGKKYSTCDFSVFTFIGQKVTRTCNKSHPAFVPALGTPKTVGVMEPLCPHVGP